MPQTLLAEAESVVTVALSYAHADGADVPVDRLHSGPRGTIAKYARGRDYHEVLHEKLKALAEQVSARLETPLFYRKCVDTAPLLERALAERSGLGFVAKNTLLILPGLGSYVLLGELLTSARCEPSQEVLSPRCGSCRLCLDACPTQAFVDAYTLDARKCISYLTIENPDAIPRALRPAIGDRIFGCDICQDVCPFNASPKVGSDELIPGAGYSRPALARLMSMGAAQFRKWQRGRALRRIFRPQLLRNVAVALGNIGSTDDLPLLQSSLEEKSELVREHVIWAINAIGARTKTRAVTTEILRRHRAREMAKNVLAEIEFCLNG